MTKTKKYKQWKKEAKIDFEKEIKVDKLKVIIRITFPIIILYITLFFLYILGPDVYLKLLKLLGVYLFTPVSRSGAAILYSFKLGFNPLFTVFIIMLIEGIISLFIIWNFDYVKVIPHIRRFVKSAEEKSHELRIKYKWIKNLQFIGIVLFVLFPLHFTGPVPGAIMGRLMKMNYFRLFIAVMLGLFIKMSFYVITISEIYFIL